VASVATCRAVQNASMMPSVRPLVVTALAILCSSWKPVRAQEVVNDPQLLGTTMVIRGLKLYVFGGMGTNSTSPQNVLWEFDLGTRLWSAVTPNSEDKPPGRMFHSATMTHDGRYMVVHGGMACFTRIQMASLEKGLKEYHMQQDSIEYSTALEDVWMFDFVTRMWSELSPQRVRRAATCPTAEGVEKLESGAAHLVPWSWMKLLLAAASVLLVSRT